MFGQFQTSVVMNKHLLKSSQYKSGKMLCVFFFFFRKLDLVLFKAECKLYNCSAGELSDVSENLGYIRSVVGTRCPHVTKQHGCLGFGLDQEKSDVPCNSVGASRCLRNITLPQQGDTHYCRYCSV